MSVKAPYYRDSQWDAPIPVSSLDEIATPFEYTTSYRYSEPFASATATDTTIQSEHINSHDPVSPIDTRHNGTDFSTEAIPFFDQEHLSDYALQSHPSVPPRSWTFQSQASLQSDISHLSSATESPDLGISRSQPQSIRRSISPSSEKEATPPSGRQPCLSISPHSRHSYASVSLLESYGKEVILETPASLHPTCYESTTTCPSPYSPSQEYSVSRSTSNSSCLGSAPLAYTGSTLAYSDTTLAYTEGGYPLHPPTDMNFFRRKQSTALTPHASIAESYPSQAQNDRSELPAQPAYGSGRTEYGVLDSTTLSEVQRQRHISTSTFSEKRSLGPQDTGILHGNGESGFGFGVQDEEKQSLQPYDHSITSQIALARTTRIKAVVDAYIEPLLRDQAANGIASTTLVLVPEVAVNPDSVFDYSSALDPLGTLPSSTPYSSEKDTKKLNKDVCRLLTRQEASDLLIGFPAELALRVVRLAPAHSDHTGHSGDDRSLLGDEGSRFWQQPPVVTELDRLLRIRLVDMGLDVQDPNGATVSHRRAGWVERGELVGAMLPAAAETRRNKEAGEKPWHGAHWDAGLGIWESSGSDRHQSSWQPPKRESLLPGQASVRVELQDVCFRTQNPMGLYETKVDQAVVVAVGIEV